MKAQKEKTTTGDVSKIISKYNDWRGERLQQIRTLMREANSEVIEDVKWKTPSNPDGVMVWYYNGMICTGEVYKKHLRISFAKGPSLKDPKGLINSYRAIIIHEGDVLDEYAFKDLIIEAIELNQKK